MKRTPLLENSVCVGLTRTRLTNARVSVKRSIMAVAFALALGMAALPIRAQASGNNPCGNLFLFAFPQSAQTGQPVSVFVTCFNGTGTSTSYVVSTEVTDPSGHAVATDARVVTVDGNSDSNFTVSFSPATTGAYTITTNSYQGNSLPVNTSSFCSNAHTQLTVVCGGNGCAGTPARGSQRGN
ncbi:MAG TPA: filamin/ABP280 repeat domain-containing protein [Blastocatellia bacterium]|nr:filamin/ABP280 repeat domain-containing protein [Blastocatellia bacterium]